jgi:hypothetical protein
MKSFVKAASAALVAASTLVPAVAFAQAAPPLTYLEVLEVCSEDDWAIYGECEPINASQSSTYADHGGSWMYAVTVEIGYGMNRFASLDSTVVSEFPNSAQAIWSNGVLIGWYRFWDLSGYSDGSFFYQSQSQNAPFNTESDTLTIL